MIFLIVRWNFDLHKYHVHLAFSWIYINFTYFTKSISILSFKETKSVTMNIFGKTSFLFKSIVKIEF